MKGLPERTVASQFSAGSLADSPNKDPVPVSSDQKSCDAKSSKASLWSSFFASTVSIFETYSESSVCGKKASNSRTYGWTTALRRAVTGGSMKRLQERIIGPSKTFLFSSTSEIWLLGVCYKALQEVSSGNAVHGNGLDAFEKDFSSRIWMTYRKGWFYMQAFFSQLIRLAQFLCIIMAR